MIIATVVSFAAKLKDAPIRLPVVDNIEPGCVCVCVVCVDFLQWKFPLGRTPSCLLYQFEPVVSELRAFVLCSL